MSVIDKLQQGVSNWRDPRSSGGLVWTYEDLFPTNSGARQLTISFFKKASKATDSEIMLNMLARGELKNEFGADEADKIGKLTCMIGSPEILFEEVDEDGNIQTAELDEKTSAALFAKAKALLSERTTSDRLNERRQIAAKMVRLLETKHGKAISSFFESKFSEEL